VAKIACQTARNRKFQLLKNPALLIAQFAPKSSIVQRLHRALLVVAPFYQGLYANGRLFGVQFEKSAPEIVTSGVGNTLQLSVPVEWKGETLAWKLNVKAIEESAPSAYR